LMLGGGGVLQIIRYSLLSNEVNKNWGTISKQFI